MMSVGGLSQQVMKQSVEKMSVAELSEHERELSVEKMVRNRAELSLLYL